jgi:hypothetical protein
MGDMNQLLLEAVDYADAAHWRWLLTRPGGEVVATHDVRLDEGCWQFEAFGDLQRYLRMYVAPDQQITQEADILRQLGDWTGEHVLGPVGDAVVAAAPVVVTITAASPSAQTTVMMRPLEVARVAGLPLPSQDVVLVMDPAPVAPARPRLTPVGETLRVLGLFSLPAGGRPLNLRAERQALTRRFANIAAEGRGVDVQVLQYGVTRDRLRALLADTCGWDIVHISGHGAPGELFLELTDGGPDPVDASELADLLELARGRLKLVTVSACWSAALGGAAQARMPELGQPEEQAQVAPGRAPALASTLVARLGCAVLAMRFPVADEFAAELTDTLYGLLAEGGEPLPRGLDSALRSILSGPPSPRQPPLSLVTPALFGGIAAGLTLAAPANAGPPQPASQLEVAGFPPAPDRLVGRVGAMTSASAALAAGSDCAGVLFYGMPGSGKTACALELAYTHEHAFDAFAWFSAADVPDESDALGRLAVTLESALPGVRLVHLLDDAAGFGAALPALSGSLRAHRLLLVLDNIESLLAEDDTWRDDRWRQLVTALTANPGLGRVVLTSRQRPAGLPDRVRAISVDTLSMDESFLLARQLPNLSAFIEQPGADDAAWQLLRRVLFAAHGLPKLLELADGQAASRAALGKALDTMGGDQYLNAMPGGRDFLALLAGWTRVATARLTAAERDLLALISRMEEADRTRAVLDGNWADFWRRLGRPDALPGLDEALPALANAGLVAADPGQAQDGNTRYVVHPAVAAPVRADSGPASWDAADHELAAYWTTMSERAGGPVPEPGPTEGMITLSSQPRESDPETGEVIVNAALRAMPYLMRLKLWEQATFLIQEAMARDRSPRTARAAAAAMRIVVGQTAGTPYATIASLVRTKALSRLDPAAVSQQMHDQLATAVAGKDFTAAVGICGDLIQLSRYEGRLSEGLRIAEDQVRYAAQSGLGPWTRLATEASKLQMQIAVGTADNDEVIAEVRQRIGECCDWPEASGQQEVVLPWNARELMLDVGRDAAVRAGRWADALEFSAGVAESQRRRGAPDSVVMPARLNDCSPLVRLGRLDDAFDLLRSCRRFYEETGDVTGLSKVLSSQADVEWRRGHGDVAVGVAQDALRYCYVVGDAEDIRLGHISLGYLLARYAGRGREALAHHLAAAVLEALSTGGGPPDAGAAAAAVDRTVFGAAARFPASVADLCGTTDAIDGVHLGRLLASLGAEDRLGQVLTEVIAAARQATLGISGLVASWDPAIAAVVAAHRGNENGMIAFHMFLSERAAEQPAAEIGQALSALVIDGKPGDLETLPAVGAAVLTRASLALAGLVEMPAELMSSVMIAHVFMLLVYGSAGPQNELDWLRNTLQGPATTNPLFAALVRIADGERGAALADGLDAIGQAAVRCVLFHIASLEQ